MMTIDEYAFGRIRIDGREYRSDVIVFPQRVDSGWWRARGHLLQPADLEEVLAAGPRILVVGSGYFGAMKISSEVKQLAAERGIRLEIARTGRAVEIYNQLRETALTVAALHLTC